MSFEIEYEPRIQDPVVVAQIENDVYDRVQTQLLEHYEIEDISELTEAQWTEIHKWQEENVSEYSPMNMGFSDCYNQWENSNYED